MYLKRKTRVLVVDDSHLMCRIIRDIINSDPDLEVIGEAHNGYEAIELVRRLKPDVVTLDVEMPKMNGLETLKYIMRVYPRPVIMVSSLTQEGADATIKALEYGAVDFIPKPSANELKEFKENIIRKLKEVSRVPIRLLEFKAQRLLQEQKHKVKRIPVLARIIVVIASSTG